MSEQRAELPPDRFTALWQRIKHHRIAQWTVGYVALAYGTQHAVILTSESFQWPNIIARASMLLLALGLPVAITLAWYHGERTACTRARAATPRHAFDRRFGAQGGRPVAHFRSTGQGRRWCDHLVKLL
jgi:hypothetical protein